MRVLFLRCPVNISKTKSITAISQVNTQDKKNAKNLNCFHVSRGRHTSASIWRKETIKDHYYDEVIFKRYARQFRRLMNVVTNIYLLIHLRIGSCLACVYRVINARGKFGEHERSVRVARGAAESNSCFLSALQTSQVHP